MAYVQNRFMALDSVRGAAMLGVMLFHIGLLPLGWISLQIFFVLSGFLITRLLFEDKEVQSPTECMRQFYLRRVYRIFPAFYVYLLFVLLMTWLHAPSAPVRDFLPAASVYLHNFAFVTYGGPEIVGIGWYWVGHLWSLAVEEHFYILWPLLILFTPVRHYRGMIFLTYLAAIAVRIWVYRAWYPVDESAAGFERMETAVHMLTGGQFDAFALGALIALMYREGAIRQPRMGFLVGLVAAGAAMSFAYIGLYEGVDRVGKIVWKYSIANLLCACVVMLVLTHPWAIRVSSRPRLAWIGQISYSMYLWHMPLAYLTKQALPLLAAPLGSKLLAVALLAPLYVAVTILIGWLSHRYIETYFLRIRPRRHAERRPQETVAQSQLGSSGPAVALR